jgi:hypothetical protein
MASPAKMPHQRAVTTAAAATLATYFRVVIRQSSSKYIKRFFSKHKSILVHA